MKEKLAQIRAEALSAIAAVETRPDAHRYRGVKCVR